MRRTVRVGKAFYHIKRRRMGWIRESMLKIWLILTANPPFVLSVWLRYNLGRE